MTPRILRRVLQAAGLGEAEAGKYSYNSCRRFLPTLVNILGFSREEAQAVGNWVDDPACGVESSAAPSMAVHYADEKALSSGMVKKKALKSFLKLVADLPEAKAIIDGGAILLQVDALPWEMLGLRVANRKRKREEKDKKGKKERKEKVQAKKDKRGKAKKH